MDAAGVEVMHMEAVSVSDDRDRVRDVGVVVAGPIDEELVAGEPLDLARPTDDRTGQTRVGRLRRPPTYQPPPQVLKISVNAPLDVCEQPNSSLRPQPPTTGRLTAPRRQAIRRPVTAIIVERHDDWSVAMSGGSLPR